ncbi:MAG TPA: oxygen-dependent coproporphyrinogen oxidase [Cytophagaceae bacterium]|jgi:coproporphyrinogen III oxidase|nr:oxygen-dependent coproporphyrinogen oxidase [Cytophagaceae bacterium]
MVSDQGTGIPTNRLEIENWFRALQNSICMQLEQTDGKAKFSEDCWTRAEGGGGISRVLSGGNVIEKGGVMFSAVWGKTPPNILNALKLEEADFYATGVSIVMHTLNPWCPIIHMNTRYFEMSNGVSWFGGGIDLTPHYILQEDAVLFHAKIKEVCDLHHPDYYVSFKKWADDYFYIKHREETRGIGGIFFDRLTEEGSISFRDRFDFVKDVGKLFAPLYSELLNRNKNKPYSEAEKKWQLLRRGRYVEFNLVYDKGTKFGLDTNGRTESILMSMPPVANWDYNVKIEEGTNEAYTLANLKKDINWIAC